VHPEIFKEGVLIKYRCFYFQKEGVSTTKTPPLGAPLIIDESGIEIGIIEWLIQQSVIANSLKE